ncbi:MAG: hypothetical protein QM717_10855 [Flavobacterium sp.]
MLQKTEKNFRKKSPKERFLLVIGILFFLVYLVLGLIVIFWKKFPLNMQPGYRIAFGVLLIGYSFLRFLRFFQSNSEQ